MSFENSQSKDWCFTINNPNDEDIERLSNPIDGVTFIVWQEERGSSGTNHFQGYVEFGRRVRLSGVRSALGPRGHYEPRRGTQQEAIDYATKEETRVEGGHSFRWGNPRNDSRRGRSEMGSSDGSGRGARREKAIQALKEIKSGQKGIEEIDEEVLLYPGFLRASMELTRNLFGPYRPNLKIITICGPTGCGKSYAAHRYGGRELVKINTANRSFWSTGRYRGRVLLIDEFVGQIELNILLQILDPYESSLPVKGGFAPSHYDTVFITTNVTPDNWYATSPRDNATQQEIEKRGGNIAALFRRIGYDYDPLKRVPEKYIEVPWIIAEVEGQRQWLKYRLEALGIVYD